MFGFTLPDFLAFGFFVAAWAAYHFANEYGSRTGLNIGMSEYRIRWMNEMSRRENRIVDANIMSSLQNGTAFFASTSLLAIGASATLLRASEDAVKIAADLPFGLAARVGPEAGLAYLRQRVDGEGSRSGDRSLLGPTVSVEAGLDWNLPGGFSPGVFAFVRTYVLPVEGPDRGPSVSALFTRGGGITLGKYF